jgi:hypothetical protein
MAVQGQRHDRFDAPGVSIGEPDEADDDAPVSLGQKMLSAVSGSLITSLLGTCVTLLPPCATRLSVSPFR